MELLFWCTDLLIPVAMLGLGFALWKHPPKTINGLYGYRTSRSMASQKTWEYANRRAGQIWVFSGAILAILIVVSKLVVSMRPENLSLIHMFISIGILMIPIPIVESELRKKF